MMLTSEKAQQVHADNIARANIPGQKAYILEKPKKGKSKAKIRPVSMRKTHPSHMGVGGGKQPLRVVKDPNAKTSSPDGNNIVIEEQAQHMGRNKIDHQVATGFYKKATHLHKTLLMNNRQ